MKAIVAALVLLFSVPCFAATCAHVETGQALDVQPCNATSDYLARYTPQVTAGWVAAIVPDGTIHNATANGDGTFTNPVIPPPAAITTISVTDFKKRFTLAEKVGIATSTDATVKVFWDELNTAGTVNLTDPDTLAGMAYLVSVNLLTQARSTAILTP